MATWKEELNITSKRELKRIPFNISRRFFAVDASGSTIGKIIKSEGEFVQKLSNNAEDRVVKWNSICSRPEPVSEIHPWSYWMGNGGTKPDVILKHAMALREIRASDAWIMTTDGEISNTQVNALTTLANSEHVMQVPIVLLIAGNRYTPSPETTNISVAIPFYAGATDAMLLYKDVSDGRIYVVSAKGAFQALSATADENITTTRDSLQSFVNEEAFNKACSSLDISVVRSRDRPTVNGASLGPAYESATGCLVDIDSLLEQPQIATDDLKQLLEDETIDRLAVICKTLGKLDKLRSLLLKHKRQEVTLRLEDRHGAGIVMDQMQAEDLTAEQSLMLRNRLREAHVLNRAAYQTLVDSPSDEAREASKVNRSINKALAYLASLDKASYTADILSRKSNRAMRAERIDAADAEVHVMALDLSEQAEAYCGECLICAGDNEIMSIVLKQLDQANMEENTMNFALDFPLAAGCAARNVNMISSQCICFQCALLCQRSIYKEDLAAILPTVVYKDTNMRYLNHQLCTAITQGLNTGTAGIMQLFMAMMDQVLEKEWCQPVQDSGLEDNEKSIRREVINWMLNNIITHCKTRETFNEAGAWVLYPQALLWAIDHFKAASLDSWLIQYPISGFTKCVRILNRIDQMQLWVTRADLGLGQSSTADKDPMSATRRAARETTLLLIIAAGEAKLIHLVVSTMMKSLLQQHDNTWAYPYLDLVYQGFNAPGVPQDLGSSSLLPADKFWEKLPEVLGGWKEVRDFLATTMEQSMAPQFYTQQRRIELCRRVQLVIFWAAFMQKGHMSPKTFFHTVRQREPLAPSVLDGLMGSSVAISEHLIMETLTSIFWSSVGQSGDDVHDYDKIAPFASPFGPSVLQCAFSGCEVKFYDEDSGHSPDPDLVRQLRAQHLKQVFGGPRFHTSSTGLPEPTQAPEAPSSGHCNLHSAIARVWSKTTREQKVTLIKSIKQLPTGEEARNDGKNSIDRFVSEVRTQICAGSGQGDIYQSLEGCIQAHLPSFLEALRVASKRAGLADESGVDYVHDWTQNKVAAKIEYELSLTVDRR